MRLTISALDLHWVTEAPHADLCAHASVQVRLDDRVLLPSTAANAVSAGALHLLRSLHVDHTADQPIAENLIPHCGHFMAIISGMLTNISCPHGANWWVVHDGDVVRLDFMGDIHCTINADEWLRAVMTFADEVSAFYDLSAPKKPEPTDADWYAAFWNEWKQLRSTAVYDKKP